VGVLLNREVKAYVHQKHAMPRQQNVLAHSEDLKRTSLVSEKRGSDGLTLDLAAGTALRMWLDKHFIY
jgi:hypothetical protein